MGALQQERRVCIRRVYVRVHDVAARGIYNTAHAFYCAEELARPASADDGIRLINIDVDSGSYSFRDEKLAKFRVTKEGEGALRNGVLLPDGSSDAISWRQLRARLRNGAGDTDVGASKAPKMSEYLDIPFYKGSNIRPMHECNFSS